MRTNRPQADGGTGRTEETLFGQAAPPGAPLPPRLFTNRPFLWLVLASGVTNLGLWSYFGAVWADAVFRFGSNPAQMSILLASFSVPFVLLVPIQGILVDRWSPKWLNTLGIAVALSGVVPAWAADSIGPLYLSSFLVGAGMGAIAPARSALTGLLVEKSRLVQANGMLSGAGMLALIVGPFTGGLILRSAGTGVLYPVVMAVMALGMVLSTLVPDKRQGGQRPALSLRDLADGAGTAWRIAELRLLLWLSAVGWLMVNVYWVLEPLFVKQGLHLHKDAVQFLWSAQGVGALIGSVGLYRTKRGPGRELAFIGVGLVVSGLGLLLFAGFSGYATALSGSALFGWGFSVYFASALALVQRLAGEEKRGRVTSVLAVLQEGTAVVTAVVIVSLGGLVVVRGSLVGSGIVLALTALLGFRSLARLEARGLAPQTPVRRSDGRV